MVKFAVGIGSGRRFHGIFGEKGRRLRGIGSGVGGPRPADARSLRRFHTNRDRPQTYGEARISGRTWPV